MPQYLKLLTKQITVLCAFIVALLLLCGCVPCLAQGAPVEIDYQTLWHDHMVVVGQPELVVEEEDFVVSYNATNLQPNWVAWRLTASRAMADGYTFEGRFASDPQVPSRFKQAKDNDYRNSGYDRGHLCPAADNRHSYTSRTQCYYYTNISPMNDTLNSGAWLSVESLTRSLALRFGEVWVIAGPIIPYGALTNPSLHDPPLRGRTVAYDDERAFAPLTTIGSSRIPVPAAFFKIIVVPFMDEPARAVGFIFDNNGRSQPYISAIRSVAQIQSITGFTFYQCLPEGHFANWGYYPDYSILWK